ncbi:MAG: hypothetical protein N2749_05705 [Clostridia bacterium]|nr:hypothetical protein [Clostridia bacterium]
MKKIKVNKGKAKNLIKRKQLIVGNRLENLKRGSETIETIVLIGISMVLIITIFFPKITSLFSGTMSNLDIWFNTMISNLNTNI